MVITGQKWNDHHLNSTEQDHGPFEGTGQEDLEDLLSSLRHQISTRDPGCNCFIYRSAMPCFVLHVSSMAFVDVNRAFVTTSGYSRETVLTGSVRAPSLLDGAHQGIVRVARRCPARIPEDPFVAGCVDQSGASFSAEISVSSRHVQNQRLLYGSLRDITEQIDTEQTLNDQLEHAIQSNRRLLRLRQKYRAIPDVTAELLQKTHKVGILTRARSMLCDRMGMNLEQVQFYLLNENDDRLERPFPNENDETTPSQEISSQAMEVARGTSDVQRPEPDVLILPLKAGDKRFGVMEVTIDPDERTLLEPDDLVWSACRELMLVLSNIIGLLIENCRLTREERQQAIQDPLTGVFNRRYFNEQLKEEVYRAKRYDHPLSLMIMDVNQFTRVNDTYGHQVGDRLLQQITRSLQQHIRSSDTLFRYGGDEFAIMLPSTTGEDAERTAETLADAFQNTRFTVKDPDDAVQEIPVQLSIGVSSLSDVQFENWTDTSEETDREQLLKTADHRMFQAKTSDNVYVVRDDSD